MLSKDDELIVRYVKNGKYLISRQVILIILHITHTLDCTRTCNEIAIRCASIKEPSILKNLNVKLIVYTIFLDNTQDICRFLSEFCDILRSCLT